MASMVGKNALLFATLPGMALVQPVACNVVEAPSLPDELVGLALEPVPAMVEVELQAFRAALASLDLALLDWQESLAAGDGSADKELARQAWIEAMGAWQRLEVLQVGPAASSLWSVGGEDLRDEIYSWPDTVSGCRVDTETVEQAWSEADFFTANFVNSYGLDALEHLLFAPLATECPAQVDIQAGWDALGESGVEANRAAYAIEVVRYADETAADLERRWQESVASDFVSGAAPWNSRAASLQSLFEALYYLETRTKDRKLAEPLGLRTCTASCGTLVESRLSGMSVAWIRVNLEVARELVEAGEDNGLDELLVQVGYPDLAEALVAAISVAEQEASSLEGPLDELIQSDPAAVTALLESIRGITDLLRGDVATVLLLQLPAEAAGDND